MGGEKPILEREKLLRCNVCCYIFCLTSSEEEKKQKTQIGREGVGVLFGRELGVY